MTTERASPSHCMKIGAFMAGIWGAVLAFILANGMFNSIDLERPVHMLVLVGSLTIVAVGIPAFRDEEMRNPASLFYLVVGVVLLGAAAALVALAFFMFLLSGWKMNSHN